MHLKGLNNILSNTEVPTLAVLVLSDTSWSSALAALSFTSRHSCWQADSSAWISDRQNSSSDRADTSCAHHTPCTSNTTTCNYNLYMYMYLCTCNINFLSRKSCNHLLSCTSCYKKHFSNLKTLSLRKITKNAKTGYKHAADIVHWFTSLTNFKLLDSVKLDQNQACLINLHQVWWASLF